MLMDVYVAGSTSSQRVAARPRMLENMSLDFQALQIDVRRLTKWDVALWVRSRVNNGAKTAGSTAKTALALAERCTDEVFHANSSLVKAQAAPAHEARASADPPKPEAPLKWAHLEGLKRPFFTARRRSSGSWPASSRSLCILPTGRRMGSGREKSN